MNRTLRYGMLVVVGLLVVGCGKKESEPGDSSGDVVGGLGASHRKARIVATRASLGNFATALQMYRVDSGRYPTNEQGLDALVKDSGSGGWRGPYLDTLKPDSWGTDYRYSLKDHIFEVRSAGPDREFNTDDDLIEK